MKLVLVILLAVVLSFSAAHAATYYVDPSGSDTTGDGSQAKPWATPAKAASVMVAGDTTLVNSGVYTTPVVFGNAGTPGNQITLKAATGQSPIIDLGGSQTDGCVTLLSYNTIDGFECRNAVDGISPTTNGTTGVQILNCVIHNIFKNIADNVAGITADQAANMLIKNTHIYDVRRLGDSQEANGILSYDGQNVTVDGSEIGPAGSTNMIALHHKRSKGSTVPGFTFKNCLIHDFAGPNFKGTGLLYDMGGGPAPYFNEYVYNCIFYNVPQPINANTGAEAGASGQSNGFFFYNNTVDMTSVEGQHIPFDLIWWANANVYNNIFYTVSEWLTVEPSTTDSQLAISDYNLVYPGPWVSALNGTTYAGSGSTIPASWRGLGFDTHSLMQDPLFVNRAGHDYHLQPGSPARGAGRVGGSSSGSVVDMGAYSAVTIPAAPSNLQVK